MSTTLKIAWRNIWRNKRRTIITVSSIAFALFFALLMRGFQEGSYDNMKQNVVEMYSGYIQIHKKGYWDDKNINNSFDQNSIDSKAFENISQIQTLIPRLESFALAAGTRSSKVVQVMGISPEKENQMTELKKFLIEGSYFKQGDKSVVIGKDLASFLHLKLNDSIVLYTSGYHGVTAAGLFKIQGILKLPSPEMNRSSLYMPLQSAQDFLGAPSMISSLVINLENMNQSDEVYQTLKSRIDLDNLEIMNWQQLNTDLVQMIESDRVGGIVMIGILYMVIAFGVFGTVLMMTNERIREFSMMISLGMQKFNLSVVVAIELLMLTALGLITGLLISYPILLYFFYNPIQLNQEMAKAMEEFNVEPIMPMSLDVSILYHQVIVVLIISLFAIIYPSVKILSLNVIKGLRS